MTDNNNEESGKRTLKKAKDLKVIDPKAAQSLSKTSTWSYRFLALINIWIFVSDFIGFCKNEPDGA